MIDRSMFDPRDYSYDIESYPNFFSCVVRHLSSGTRWIFEISDWKNDAADFCAFMALLSAHGCRLIGFNNFYYDWQVCEHILSIGPTFTALDAYRKTDLIINGCGSCIDCNKKNGKCETNFKSTVWGSRQSVTQIDLYLLHHFDNKAKRTSLKQVEYAMRSRNIGDLPHTPGTPIPEEMRQPMIVYNCHDTDETAQFYIHSMEMIKFREDLIEEFGADVLCYNDTKIGKKYFEKELKSRVPHLFANKKKLQTLRPSISFNDVIIPWIDNYVETPQLQTLIHTLRRTTITETNSPPEMKNLTLTFDGFVMDVGAGGGHGSVERQCVRATEELDLVDIDVASYYPNLAIQNEFFPAHLSREFCDIYLDVYNRRKSFKKKTAPNEMLKLALNGVYGDSNNVYSIFFDPQYTMSITINGQLLLYLLAEKLVTHTNAKMVQLNTDGLTFLIPKNEREAVKNICKWWEDLTKLELEEANYSAMWIRDVNNYVAQYTDGKLKRIGAYAHETQRENPATREVKWNKDHSALVVKKAVEAEMVHGQPVRDFILNHTDAFDFMLCSKVTGKTRQRLMRNQDVDEGHTYSPMTDRRTGEIMFDPKGNEKKFVHFKATAGQWLQKVTRYYIAKKGHPLQTVFAPTWQQPHKDRIVGVNVGWEVAVCDEIEDFDASNINYEWYVQEAEKLVIR